MRLIKKTNAPSSFQQYIVQPNATFEDMDAHVKEDLRLSLFKEQYGVCAYCQRKLPTKNGVPIPFKVKIEHHCEQSICNGKNGFSNLTLVYKNLFLVCLGVGPNSTDFHCDTHKATLSITKGLPMQFIPTKKSHIDTIKYSKGGNLTSNDFFNTEINNILKLNIDYLKERRRKSRAKILSLSKDSSTRGYNKTKMKRILEEILAKKNGCFINHFPGLYEYMLKKFCS
ncbi:MAG: hypothetical protein AB8G86_27305 [Saprospiraceae bacterium]